MDIKKNRPRLDSYSEFEQIYEDEYEAKEAQKLLRKTLEAVILYIVVLRLHTVT